MNQATAARLLDLNRRFYEERGRDFSATRSRLQPGVKRLIEKLDGGEAILDLGCGNGELAGSLARRGHRGHYVGLDSSRVLLTEAAASSFSFPVRFVVVDLARPGWVGELSSTASGAYGPPFDVAFSFALFHHIPGPALRSSIVCQVRDLLVSHGLFIVSNWRFTHSARMSRRIQPWSAAGLAPEEVDPNDYLLDWRRGGSALRYVHQFDEAELAGLASSNGFEVAETFFSDGVDHQSSIYQVWRKRLD